MPKSFRYHGFYHWLQKSGFFFFFFFWRYYKWTTWDWRMTMTQNKSMKISATRGIIDAHTLLTPMTMLNYSSTKELLLLNLTLHTKLTIFTQVNLFFNWKFASHWKFDVLTTITPPQSYPFFQLKNCLTLTYLENTQTTKLIVFQLKSCLTLPYS